MAPSRWTCSSIFGDAGTVTLPAYETIDWW
jgi:hypothetical protein